ncbi:bifunctional P-450/NADPH-P450 reductase [Amylocystis lapponica]|nr:bifunctional P-450/NADPH-P450 reductase [Amylocystis lapponica]
MTTPIPSPPAIPFLGHIATVEKEVPIRSFCLLAEQYGEIFRLDLVGRSIISVNSHELVNEISDEKRFRKIISANLEQVRHAAGDGLFTVLNPKYPIPQMCSYICQDRLLMPAFNPATVRGMFDDMMDVVLQLVLKWSRFGPQYVIDPAADYTRLTLEAITLCSMSYRFLQEQPHPFVQAMTDFLVESGHRANRPTIVKAMMRSTNAKYEEDQRILNKTVTQILEDRKTHPTDKKDVLHTMMTGRDKETGLGMSDQSIKNNLVTFLIAGMLTFTTYYLLKNPEAMRKLREEIDTKIGNRAMTADDVHKLPYLLAIMRESLRLGPTAPARPVTPIEDTTLLGGKYAVHKDVTIMVNVMQAQRDPKVWGEDANEFRPERMLNGKFEALPPNAWQPFGFGMRGCIGRPFAWQEAQIALVCILQRFDLVLQDPTYELALKQTLAIKPDNFYIHAMPRAGAPHLLATPSSTLIQSDRASVPVESGQVAPSGAPKQPLYVLYGSNTGSSEAFAQRLATDATTYGFRSSIGTLDSAAGRTDRCEPADNAAHFVEWLSNLKGGELPGVKYGVFGCGNRDWQATFQRIPKLCDSLLAERGAARVIPRGEGDAGSAEFFEAFNKWEAQVWETLTREYQTKTDEGATDGIEVKMVSDGTARAEVLRQPDAALGTVVENRILTAPNAPEKRHIELELPKHMTYRAGDYLAILPTNPARDVKRAIARFGLTPEQGLTISSAGPTSLPINRPISLFTLLSGYVELSQAATTRDLRILSECASIPEAVNALADLFTGKVAEKRLSVLDILEDNPGIKITLSRFLTLLPSMRLRQYSIASSPLAHPQRVTLTISVLAAPAASGRAEPFLGVASTYLAGLRAGDRVQLAVRASSAAFHPPVDPTVPLVMLCAGSGLAPMRGFLEERPAQKEAGREVARSLLFFGCRAPAQDFLYGETDLKRWAGLGVVDVRPAFSRAAQDSAGCKYVQDRLWRNRADIVQAFEAGCKIFVCGSGKVAVGVKETLVAILKEHSGSSDAEATERFAQITKDRFATDVFE